MKWATLNGKRVLATPGAQANCPLCKEKVVSKCGGLNVWHWSHQSKDCDPWHEPETEWHKNWKDLYPQNCQEVALESHRADIKTNELVVELQHSPIKIAEIDERELFYNDMVWVFDARHCKENIAIDHFNYSKYRDAKSRPFEWKWARRSLRHCKKPVFITLGKYQLYNIHSFGGSSGYCIRFSKEEFLAFTGHPNYERLPKPYVYDLEGEVFESPDLRRKFEQSRNDDPF